MSKILIVGESCLDIFVYCDALRLSPDIPVPVLNPNHEERNPGMAMNVKRNIESLGETCEILTNENWEQVTKSRLVHELTNHTFLRIDSLDKVERGNFDND